MKIIDNFFSNSEYVKFVEDSKVNEFGKYKSDESWARYVEKTKMSNEFRKIISCEKLEYGGVEWWVQNSNLQNQKGKLDIKRHTDTGQFEVNGNIIFKNSKKTFVYYVEISDNFSGGKLIIYQKNTNNILKEVSPKQNRLVIFDSDLEHEVSEFTGDRISVILNPWDQPPVGVRLS